MAQAAQLDAGQNREKAAPANSTTTRLDPWQLPQRIEQTAADGASWTIDRQGVVLKRRLCNSGLDVSLALPARAFRGVAARATEHEDGSYTVTLQLLHHDAQLCVTLLESSGMEDIAADWHGWSRMMRLPMLMVEADGVARPVRDELGAVMVNSPLARRKRHATLKHRPRFLKRRKPGSIGPVEKISAEELIARR
jgi:hypothetical protein